MQESLGIENVDNEIRSKPYISIKDSDAKQFTFISNGFLQDKQQSPC